MRSGEGNKRKQQIGSVPASPLRFLSQFRIQNLLNATSSIAEFVSTQLAREGQIVAGFHFKMSSSYINLIVLLLISSVSRYFDAEAAAADPTSLTYDTKVCNNEPTCNLTTTIANLSADKLTFPWRDCMCDAECSEYEDCCPDSQYIKNPKLNTPPKTYHCSPDAKVYMVVSCLPNYADEQIKKNCAKAFQPLDTTNFALLQPVTNTAKRITYANAYCALCNKDEDFSPWTLLSGCGEVSKELLEQRAAEVKKEASTASSPKTAASPTTTAAPTSSNPNSNRLNINFHLDPGAILGKKDSNGGFSKTISIPTFGSLGTKLANKTIGSETGIFGAKTTTGRRKRYSDLGSINYYTYATKVSDVLKVAKFDPTVMELIAKYNNKTLVCKLGSRMPNTFSKAVRRCVPSIVSKCPQEGEANKVCQSYLRLVHDGQQSYRNIDCAKCNGVDPKTTSVTGCLVGTRTTGASSLWSAEAKGNAENGACDTPEIAEKVCK